MAKHGPVPKKLDASRVESVAAMGGTNDQIADALGVSPKTLQNIRKRDADIDVAVKRGKDKADLQVVAALYKKAIGYETLDKAGKACWAAGDTTAMIFWLKNRRPGEWKDRKDVAVGGENGGPIHVKLEKVVTVIDPNGSGTIGI